MRCMNRMRIALATIALGILVSVVGSAGASGEPPTLRSTPKAKLGTHVVITGLYFKQFVPATLYLESGTTRRALGTQKVPRGGQFRLSLTLPRTAPKDAHLLACQNKCSSRVRLALVK
jgi:hypothetical protein